jgi:WD40 repeat protein
VGSGSADSVVRVWDIKNNGHKSLQYHKQSVRSLAWNYEIPWLLISGCDNSELAIWDIRSNELITSIHEESIAVSAISTHPKRPFAYATSHLDNSVIFWDILDLPDIAMVSMKFFLELPLTDIICDAHD